MAQTIIKCDRALVDDRLLGATDILVEDGAIAALGVGDSIDSQHAKRVDWRGRLAVPGTVNAHNHSFQSLLRGIGDDLAFLEWRDRALYRYAPRLDADALYTGALFAFGEMLLNGVTTVADFFYLNDGANENAQAVIEAARALGIRIVLARSFYDWEGAPQCFRESVAVASANFTALARSYPMTPNRMVSIHPAPHSLHGASREMILEAARCGEDAKVPIHIHLAEERYQVDEALRVYGKRPLFAIDEMGVLTSRLIAVHGCWFDEAERALLAERNARLAYNPASNMFLGDGVTDIVDLRRRGVRVALGTDGGCSNSRVSIFDEMRSCALLQKVHRLDGQAIAAEDCFAMGARLGGEVLDLPVGRLAPGFRADLVALDLGHPSLWPLPFLAKNLVYSLSPCAVKDVMVDGEIVVANGTLTKVRLETIGERVAKLTHDWRT